MLANNIRDVEEDTANERYTLMYYIKRPWAVRLYVLLSIIPWICWADYILSGILPWWAVIGFIALIPHSKIIPHYVHHYKEPKSFVEGVKSFALFSARYTAIMLIYTLTAHL